MMELALIKTMMNKEFYERHKGIRCPDKIFTKDTRKIKCCILSTIFLFTFIK